MLCGSAVTLFGAALAAIEETPHAPPPTRLHAPLPGSDGVYGRLDGSLALSLSAGAELEAGEPRASLRIGGHYLWTAGAYVRYADALGADGARPSRVLSLGVDVRPLFLPRFALDLEQGPALLDLALDSLSIDGGVFLAQPRHDSFAAERGFELGLGLGLPLRGQAEGPWLEARAERRFAEFASKAGANVHAQDAWLFSVFFSWHALTWTTEPAR